MKTTLIFATSINGYIAEADHTVHWSNSVWKAYQDISSEIGNMIVGKFTYQLMLQSGEIDTLGLKNLVVVSAEGHGIKHHVEATPELALSYLQSLGQKEVIVCGGASIATHLIQNNLLNEIILDFDPVIINSGIPMFGNIKNLPVLKLMSTKILGEDTVRIHYKVQ